MRGIGGCTFVEDILCNKMKIERRCERSAIIRKIFIVALSLYSSAQHGLPELQFLSVRTAYLLYRSSLLEVVVGGVGR